MVPCGSKAKRLLLVNPTTKTIHHHHHHYHHHHLYNQAFFYTWLESQDKFKYLENEKSFKDEVKNI